MAVSLLAYKATKLLLTISNASKRLIERVDVTVAKILRDLLLFMAVNKATANLLLKKK